jgi:cation transport ATPase
LIQIRLEAPVNREPHIDRNALDANIQRTVDQVALRKVRRLADDLEAEQAAKQRFGNRAMIVVLAVVALLAVWFVSGLIASDRKFERGQAIPMPDKVVVPKKE